MRRLFVHGRLTDRGGADRWLWGVLRRLEGPRRLLVGSIDREAPAEVRAAAGEVVRVKELDRSGLSGPPGPGLRRVLAAAIEAFSPDVIISNDLVDPTVMGLLAEAAPWWAMVQDHRAFCPGMGKWHAEQRVCAETMGAACAACLPDPDYGPRMRALTEARRDALRRATGVTVLSQAMRQELLAVGLEPARVVVVPPFVDGLPALSPGPLTHHLFAGRLTAHKGVRQALAAAAQTRLPLRVVGAGPLADEVRAAGIAVEWVDRAGLAQALSGAASLWLPSLWAEPFGIIGLEALSAGVPVIGSAVGGVGDWLDDRVGCLVPPGDVGALVAAARRLEDDPSLCRRLGAAGAARVAEGFEPARIVTVLQSCWRVNATSSTAPTG